MTVDEVYVKCWTEAHKEQAVDELTVDEQASFVGDAECAIELEWQVAD